ncbi:hypothetical protein [Mitsuaria sp. TWR114]|uniref:hypothetical protein n=1 Tax=Mitsuaria sp. TWR114 TaxID=2601731 RepID=UPI002103E768|nr:hypothetical protein [Mitsuaria sp. TWR114]
MTDTTRTPSRAALPAWLAASLMATAMAASMGAIPGARAATAAGEDRYTMADFAKVPKIDAHVHLHNADPAFVDAARRLGFRVLTINVDYPDFPPLDEQQRVAVALRQARPAAVAWAVSFSSDTSTGRAGSMRRSSASMPACVPARSG